MTAQHALAQALVTHQPRYYGEPGYWPDTADKIAASIIASLTAAGWALSPLIDFPDQTCPACAGEHSGADCPQEVLPL